jgi:hypothetical protein
MAYFSVISWHSPGGTNKNRENLGQYNRCPDRDSNWEPPKYKHIALPLQTNFGSFFIRFMDVYTHVCVFVCVSCSYNMNFLVCSG